MNIFYLDTDPVKCAEYHCDKHVIKMIVEYAQLLSTAHRLIDGQMYIENVNGRNLKRWKLPDYRENILYKATHWNHPSAIWVRESSDNYQYLFQLWTLLFAEYRDRYGDKHHKTANLYQALQFFPDNIEVRRMTNIPLAMPSRWQSSDSVLAYRNYYINEKKDIAKWTNKEPHWF